MQPQERTGPLTPEEAAEVHAVNRLSERYDMQRSDARLLMYEHLALILAGDSRLIAKTFKNRTIRMIEGDSGPYWIVYSDDLRRIVTYLREKPTLAHRVEQGMDRRRQRRGYREDEE